MPAQFDHEKLRAYQEALRFASWVEPVIEQLSGQLAAKDQLDRASTSIVLNIAEGNRTRTVAASWILPVDLRWNAQRVWMFWWCAKNWQKPLRWTERKFYSEWFLCSLD